MRDPWTIFLESEHLPRETWINGQDAPPRDLVESHMTALVAFRSTIVQCYAEQRMGLHNWHLTEDDVRLVDNHVSEVAYQVELVRWRERFGRVALDFADGDVPEGKRTDAHVAAKKARPPEPDPKPTASQLRVPVIQYAWDEAVAVFLASARQRGAS